MFSDPKTSIDGDTVSTATLDRLTHRCHIPESGNHGYRFKNRAIHRKKGETGKTG